MKTRTAAEKRRSRFVGGDEIILPEFCLHTVTPLYFGNSVSEECQINFTEKHLLYLELCTGQGLVVHFLNH